jgi:hypothetical protein
MTLDRTSGRERITQKFNEVIEEIINVLQGINQIKVTLMLNFTTFTISKRLEICKSFLL